MIQQQPPPIRSPPLSGDVNAVLSDVYTSFTENIPLPTGVMPDEITKASLCQANCSGNGECRDGSCYCMVINIEIIVLIIILETDLLIFFL